MLLKSTLISDAPLVKQFLPITAEEGDATVSLTCTVSSKPVATLTLSKVESGFVLITGQGSTLTYTLRNITRNDTGTYRCEADNQVAGTNNKDIQLTINCK